MFTTSPLKQPVAARKALRFSDDRETLVNQVTSLHRRQLAQSELQCRKPVAACALCYTDVEDLREENSALREKNSGLRDELAYITSCLDSFAIGAHAALQKKATLVEALESRVAAAEADLAQARAALALAKAGTVSATVRALAARGLRAGFGAAGAVVGVAQGLLSILG